MRRAEGAATRRLVTATAVLFALCALGLSVSVVRSVDGTALGRAASPETAVVVAVLSALAAAGVTLVVLWGALGLRDGPRPSVALVLLAVVAYPPALVLGVEWLNWSAVLGCFLLELLVLRWAVPLYAAALLLEVGFWRAAGQDWGAAVYAGVSYLATSVLLYLVLRSVTTYRELERARAELSRAEVLRERVRVSRDLHDLLGRNLAAISLKTELARRYQRAGRGEALQSELDEVLALSHAAAADLRTLVAGYRAMSMRSELSAAVRLLTDAGVRCEVDAAEHVTAETGPAADEVAGWVLREAATNVLKHAVATRCVISVDVVAGALRVVVENDGAGAGTASAGGGRAGLVGVRERVHALGGTVEVTSGGGSFRLQCTLPGTPVEAVGDGSPAGRRPVARERLVARERAGPEHGRRGEPS